MGALTTTSWGEYLVRPDLLQLATQELGRIIQEDRKQGLQFEAMAVCGASGMIVGGALSYKLGVPLVLVRKETDKHHSDYVVEYYSSFRDYIVVDDLISTGRTIGYIQSIINAAAVQRQWVTGIPEFKKIYLYSEVRTGMSKFNVPIRGINIKEVAYLKRQHKDSVVMFGGAE